MKFIHLAIIACLLILVSCKKDEKVFEVIYPGPYFPVYPNSWWKYMNQDSVISYHFVDASYKLDSYLRDKETDSEVYSEPYYVPFYDGNPIYYYDKISPCATFPWPYSYVRWPILSEQTGFAFQKDYEDPRYGRPFEWVVVKGKYFNGTDSILVQESHMTKHVDDCICTQEYAKNIGLIRQFTYDTLTCDTVSKSWLIDYYVSFDSTSIDYQ